MFRMFMKIFTFIPVRILYPSKMLNKKILRQHKGRGVILVSNHKANADIPMYFHQVNRKLYFLGKGSLFKKNPSKWFFTKLLGYPIFKDNNLAIIRHSVDVVKKKNGAMLIFPEGNRVFNAEDALALRNGSSMIAIKTGAPVIPMVMDRKPKLFRRVKIKIGTPISTAEFGGKATKEQLTEFSNNLSNIMKEMLFGFEKPEKDKREAWDIAPLEVARTIIINNENGVDKLLLIKRTKQSKNNGEPYYVTPGGHIDSGETPKQAAIREVFEETGLTIDPKRILYKRIRKGSGKEGSEGVDRDKMEAFFVCEYKGGRIVKNAESEEYVDGAEKEVGRDGETRGTFEPIWVPLSTVFTPEFNMQPEAVKWQLQKDIEKKTTRLVKRTTFLD